MPATRSRRRIGILGGTFDPVHVGHLAIARAATEALALDELRFVPTARSWQKAAAGADAGRRCDMLRAAIGSTPGWQVDEREIRRGGASYTVDTLESLREELGADAAIVLVLGSDQFRNLDTWHRYRELLRFAHIATTQRERVALADPPPAVAALLDAHGREALPDAPAGSIVYFRMPAVAISSSALRRALARGERPLELLPPGVIDYIGRHGLYRD